MADRYLVPRRLDDPELIGFWTIDEFAGLLVPFAWGILAQHIIIGTGLSVVTWFALRKAKAGNAGSKLVHAAYWYGPVHFDDIEFQMSAQGQQLQVRFVETYADRLHGEIADELVLPPYASVVRPGVSSPGDVRSSVMLGGPPSALSNTSSERENIEREVARVQEREEQRVDGVTDYLERRTRDARGASAEAADDVKKW